MENCPSEEWKIKDGKKRHTFGTGFSRGCKSVCQLFAISYLAMISSGGTYGSRLPSPVQLHWQTREVEVLIHFGINAFTAKDWGSGTEDPDVFAPTSFDPDQWVDAAKSFGAKALILTAKHHDGFVCGRALQRSIR